MRFAFTFFGASGLALALAACGSPEAENAAPREATFEPTMELSAIQKGSFERLNRDEVQTDYSALWENLEQTDDGALPARGDMNFAWLDRDGDGKLSVAEFALWEIPVQSSVAAGRPRSLSDEQLTKTASVFFSNDVDGDTLLSEREFAAASGQPVPADEEASGEA